MWMAQVPKNAQCVIHIHSTRAQCSTLKWTMAHDHGHDVSMPATGSAGVDLLASASIYHNPITTTTQAVIGSRPSPFMEGAAAAEALLQGLAEDPLGTALATGQAVVENALVERDSPGLSLMEQALTWPVTGPLALPSGNALPSGDPLTSRNPLTSGRALTSGNALTSGRALTSGSDILPCAHSACSIESSNHLMLEGSAAEAIAFK